MSFSDRPSAHTAGSRLMLIIVAKTATNAGMRDIVQFV